MALLGVSMGLRSSQALNMFSPHSFLLSGWGSAHLWPLLSEGLPGAPVAPFHLAPQGLAVTADQRCTGPWLESVPEASQGPGKKVQLLVYFPLEGGSGWCPDRRPQSPQSHAGDSASGLPMSQGCFRSKSLRWVCSEPLSSGRCKTFILTAVQRQDRGRGQA